MTAVEKPAPPDAELWEAVSGGNVEAFETLYKRHWPALLDEAYRRLKVREEAEEVVQEVFIQLYTRRNSLVIRQSLAAYLHRAVQYAVYNKIRSYIVQRNYKALAHLQWTPAVEDGPALAELRELDGAVRRAVRRLPEKCRQVFLLSREQGLGYRQIALELNISTHTVERHINKALKIIREDLGTLDATPLVVLALTGVFLAG